MDELMRRRAQMLAAKKEYIIFADPEVERICIQRYSSDGIGVTMQDAARATTLSTYFKGNTIMVSFDEFQYFTGITQIYTNGEGSNAQGAFYNCTNFVSTVLPSGITNISNAAFKSCTSLQSVTSEGTITQIGGYAFYGDTSLSEIPDLSHVTYMGRWPFTNCTSLEIDVNMPSLTSYDDTGHFRGSGIKRVISLGTITRIYNNNASNGGMFYGCKKLTDVTIPSTVTAIDRSSFDGGCTALTTVNFNSAHCSVGQAAFYGCTGLTTITNSDNITSIALSAFYNCSSLTSISLRSCTSIGGGTGSTQGAFKGGTSLTNVTFGNSLTSLAACVFQGCSNLVTADLPTSVTTIGQQAFYGCTKLTGELYLPNLTSIGDAAFHSTKITKITSLGSITVLRGNSGTTNGTFRNCTSLTEVVFPSTLTTIQRRVFMGCTSLTGEIRIPGLTSIALEAFYNTRVTRVLDLGSITQLPAAGVYTGVFGSNSSLTEIWFPSTMTSIGNYSFYGDTGLQKFVCLATTPPTIGTKTFNKTNSTFKIYVPYSSDHSVLDAYKAATNWSSFASRIHELDANGNIPT